MEVWKVALADSLDGGPEAAVLSADEAARASQFYAAPDRNRWVRAHVALRRILAEYLGQHPTSIRFSESSTGKPGIVPDENPKGISFNLSHSGDLALVAVVQGAAIGVDIERWDNRVEFLDLARHYFSAAELRSLQTLAADPLKLMQGFFRGWSRKEAYLKATGDGIGCGLQHFDVAILPAEPAALLADRLKPGAPSRWKMHDLEIETGYSAAVVAERPIHDVCVVAYAR